MNRLRNKVAIVTGAGSGIGRAVAIAFAQEGGQVVVNDWGSVGRYHGSGGRSGAGNDRGGAEGERKGADGGRGEATVEAIRAAGGEAVYFGADVSKEDEVKALVRAAVETFGRLDIMVNNAGVYVSKPLQELTEDDFDRVTSVNQKGTFFGIKHAVPAMVASGGGSIINTASIAADHGQRGSLVYGATKGAILSMTRIAATELAKFHIRVNAVQPGVIDTSLTGGWVFADPEARAARILRETPLGHRKGTPEDCAPLYVFLASDESAFITGQKLAVDGGILADSHII